MELQGKVNQLNDIDKVYGFFLNKISVIDFNIFTELIHYSSQVSIDNRIIKMFVLSWNRFSLFIIVKEVN